MAGKLHSVLALAKETIPTPNGIEDITHTSGSTPDIMDEIRNTFDRYKTETRSFALQWAESLANVPIEERLRQLHAFTRRNIRYELDPPGKQWIKTPARTFWDGFGDCKSYSIFIASVLHNWGMQAAFRYVSFKPGPFTHVYVVAYHNNENIIIDACLPQFNNEKPYLEKKDVMTEIATLSGIAEVQRMMAPHNSGKPRRKSIKRKTPITIINEDITELRCLRGALRRQGKRYELAGAHADAAKLYDIADFIADLIQAANSKDITRINAIENDFIAGGYSLRQRGLFSRKHFNHGRRLQLQRQKALCACERNGISPLHAVKKLQNETPIRHTTQPKHPLIRYQREVIAGLEQEFVAGIGRRKRGGGLTKFVKKTVDKAKGAVNQGVKKAKGLANKGIKLLKKTNPLLVLARNSYLLLLKVNAFGWATRIGQGFADNASEQNKKALFKFTQRWESLGGDKNTLHRNIKMGMKKKPLLAKDTRVSGASIGYIGEVTVGTALASASTIIATLKPLLDMFSKAKGSKEEGAETETEAPTDPNTIDETAADGVENAADEPDMPDPAANSTQGGKDGKGGKDKGAKKGMFGSVPKWLLWTGGIAVAGGVTYGIYSYSSKKRTAA